MAGAVPLLEQNEKGLQPQGGDQGGAIEMGQLLPGLVGLGEAPHSLIILGGQGIFLQILVDLLVPLGDDAVGQGAQPLILRRDLVGEFLQLLDLILGFFLLGGVDPPDGCHILGKALQILQGDLGGHGRAGGTAGTGRRPVAIRHHGDGTQVVLIAGGGILAFDVLGDVQVSHDTFVEASDVFHAYLLYCGQGQGRFSPSRRCPSRRWWGEEGEG